MIPLNPWLGTLEAAMMGRRCEQWTCSINFGSMNASRRIICSQAAILIYAPVIILSDLFRLSSGLYSGQDPSWWPILYLILLGALLIGALALALFG